MLAIIWNMVTGSVAFVPLVSFVSYVEFASVRNSNASAVCSNDFGVFLVEPECSGALLKSEYSG